MKKITILVPCHNEAENIGRLYETCREVMDGEEGYLWEILFVNDGSTDGTIDILMELHDNDPRVEYIDLSRNFGKENAMLAGFDYATGDAVVIMDADMQHPPQVIPLMLRRWEEGYDDVYGRRLTRGKESWLRRKMSLLFYKILQRSARYDVLQNVGDFRLLDHKCIEALRQMRESERYTKGMFAWIGFRKTAVDFETLDRVAGSSSWGGRSLINFAIEGIVSFTTAPLRFASVMGVVVSLLAFLYLIYIIAKTLIWGEPVQGYPTLMCVILFLGGVQLLSIGIIGEYLGRVFNETKRRPPYVVQNSSLDRET